MSTPKVVCNLPISCSTSPATVRRRSTEINLDSSETGRFFGYLEYLARTGPQIGESTNRYFNFYATQVLRQYGGPEWTKWNSDMSAHLVKTQSREGATKGSWMFDAGTDLGPAAGGRIYCTAMSVMTLEVYYRFLPIYRDRAMQDGFPLD